MVSLGEGQSADAALPPDQSVSHIGWLDDRIIADGRDAFQGDVSGPLGSFVILLNEDGADDRSERTP